MRFAIKRQLGSTVTVIAALICTHTANGAPPTARHQINEILELIETESVIVPHTDTLFATLREGLFRSLDPYSEYLDEQQYADLERDIEGSFSGIGALLEFDSTMNMVRIRAPFRGAPAERVGIRAGDVLISVNGISMSGRSVDDARNVLIGVEGTPLTVTVRREGSAEELSFAMKRGNIPIPSVRGYRHSSAGDGQYLVDEAGGVGYIRIGFFAKTTAEEFVEAVERVEAAGATSIVLDLRASSGGLMRAAIETADQLLDSGIIVTVKQRGDEKVYKAERGSCTALPIAMLIDDETASSSEIFAAAIADNRRATVLGPSHSFGKGHGQQLFKLKKGRGAVKLTTFSYHRPSGKPLERRFGDVDSASAGIWPDSGLTISISAEERETWADAVFETEERMLFTDDYFATLTPITIQDKVLERAIQFLREGR